MQRHGKYGAAAQRAAERRAREDAAPRLSVEVPSLQSLRLEVDETSSGGSTLQRKYTRFVVVSTAPALFVVPCGDSYCIDGGHELTNPMMAALQAGKARFAIDDECHGSIGTSPCARVLHLEGVAEYR
jgi:hypothetical protein